MGPRGVPPDSGRPGTGPASVTASQEKGNVERLLFTLGLIVAGLVTGYVLQRVLRRKSADHDRLLTRLRKSLQRLSILGIMPISSVGALWVVPFGDLRVALLPFIGSGVILLGGLMGLGAAILLGKKGPQKSVLFCCGSFSNIGAFGGLTSFYFFGEQGFALLALYKVFEELLYYGIGFPVARYFRVEGEKLRIGRRLLEQVKDPFFTVATGSFALGLGLNLSGAARPAGYETLIRLFVPVGVYLLLVSIGLGMRFSSVGKYLGEGTAIVAVKFLLLPLAAGTASFFLGLNAIQDGLPLKIVLIASSMPVAFNALVAASVYDLDLEMANACWLITTGSMVLVLPWLYFLFGLF